jgi:hypothetical protein
MTAPSAGTRIASLSLSLALTASFIPFAQVVHVVKKSTGAHYAMKVQAKDTLMET